MNPYEPPELQEPASQKTSRRDVGAGGADFAALLVTAAICFPFIVFLVLAAAKIVGPN